MGKSCAKSFAQSRGNPGSPLAWCLDTGHHTEAPHCHWEDIVGEGLGKGISNLHSSSLLVGAGMRKRELSSVPVVHLCDSDAGSESFHFHALACTSHFRVRACD